MNLLNLLGVVLYASLTVDGALISHCIDGQKQPLKGDCNKYLECINNKWHVKQCSNASFSFDTATNSCRDSIEVRCDTICENGEIFYSYLKKCVEINGLVSLTAGQECESGKSEPYPGSCSKYYQCVNGKKMENSCWFFERFNPEILKCDFIWNVDCKEGLKCKSGDKVSSGDCKEYFQCEYGYWKNRQCGTLIGLQMYFDSISKNCMIVGSTCSSVECSIEGLKTSLPTDCSKYRICQKGQFHERSCGWFQKFDTERNECRYIGVDCTATQGKSTCVSGDRLSVDNSCYSYKECVDGQIEKKYCFYPLYRFDKHTKTCEFMATCDTECYDGELIPAKGACNQYYRCTEGKYQAQTCSNDLNFDVVTSTCKEKTIATCGN